MARYPSSALPGELIYPWCSIYEAFPGRVVGHGKAAGGRAGARPRWSKMWLGTAGHTSLSAELPCLLGWCCFCIGLVLTFGLRKLMSNYGLIRLKDSSRANQLGCVINYFFQLHLVLHAFVQNFFFELNRYCRSQLRAHHMRSYAVIPWGYDILSRK